MSTPTEVHLDLALQMVTLALARSGNVAAAKLIADSEARAVASAIAAVTCTHHNDQQRAACPVCLATGLTAERDQLRAEVERLKKQAVFDADHTHTLNAAFATRAEVTDANARAERAEAKLAAERARLDWLETPSGMDWQWEPERLTVSRASIDAAMKEAANKL